MSFTDITYDDDSDGNALTVNNGSFSWSKKAEDVYLKNINVKVKEGKLVAVVGAVGAGKSSLISALLGDMEKIEGEVNISGSIAYVPQQAWIQNATVRQNITFTGAFEETKYNKIMEACALEADLKTLAASDLTEIGEKGINLSGGQKQRISVARAVYSNADIYLLDDPLSAVDAHVGKHIFDKVIGPQGCLKRKTRFLVTHRIALLPQVDEIIVMKDGKVSEQGSYLELLARKGEFAAFLVEYLASAGDDDDEELEKIKDMVRPELERHMSYVSQSSPPTSVDGLRERLTSVTSDVRKEATPEKIIQKKPSRPNGVAAGKLTDAESAATGSVKISVYRDYIRAMGWKAFIVIIVGTTISNGFNIGSSLWLTQWSNDAVYPDRANDTDLRNLRLGVYGGLGILEATFLFFANLLVFLGTLRASNILHNIMLDHILRAPMSFFDTTPLGRILNRYVEAG